MGGRSAISEDAKALSFSEQLMYSDHVFCKKRKDQK
jgi:hypothetical protein